MREVVAIGGAREGWSPVWAGAGGMGCTGCEGGGGVGEEEGYIVAAEGRPPNDMKSPPCDALTEPPENDIGNSCPAGTAGG